MNPDFSSEVKFHHPSNHCLGSIFLALALTLSAIADDIRHTVAVIENPAADYLSICGWEFNVEGGGYSTCMVDLNGDERLDQMFCNAGTSGTGGRAATIYLARKDGKFTRIGTLGHQGIATESIKTGGKLLHCSSNGGGGASAISTYLISHEGLKEIMTTDGTWSDKDYQKRFRDVFATSLELKYQFVAAKPKPKTEQDASDSVEKSKSVNP